MTGRSVHLSPRLDAAVSLVNPCKTVADIGCDHGRVSAVLLQRHLCGRVIASDISNESLSKARNLIRYIGLGDYVSFRLGDGLSVLDESECDAVMILGMGGTLMVRLLDSCPVPLKGAGCVILQPMRAQADIREYLHRNNYRITDDLIISEHRRFYQVLKAYPNHTRQSVPKGWPAGFYDLGFVSYLNREERLRDLALDQIKQYKLRMHEAKGSSGESYIAAKIDSLEQILNLL